MPAIPSLASRYAVLHYVCCEPDLVYARRPNYSPPFEPFCEPALPTSLPSLTQSQGSTPPLLLREASRLH